MAPITARAIVTTIRTIFIASNFAPHRPKSIPIPSHVCNDSGLRFPSQSSQDSQPS
jgi:hypothetical protein